MSSPLADEYKKDKISFDVFRPPAGISERFDVLECLSKNDHSETYLLARKDDGRKFVLKTFKKSETTFETREAEILRELDNKGLPRFESEFETDNTLYTLREYAEGISLSQYVENSGGKLDPMSAAQIATQLCDILTYLHSQKNPVIHRDVKPSNIIINPDDSSVKLIDFGISRRYSKDAVSDTTYFGTKEFSPPEQFGFAQTDSRTDIYALGVVLKFMLTGSPDGKVDDKRLARIIEKCTAFAPDDRYKNAATLKKDLSRYRKRELSGASKVALRVLSVCAALGIVVFGIFLGRNIFGTNPPQELIHTVTPPFSSIEDIDEREYTDEQLRGMLALSASQLQENINTLADAITFLDMKYPNIWMSNHIWIGAGSGAAILRSGAGILDDAVETDAGEGVAGRSDIVTAVAYLLSDNYEIGGLYGFCYDSEGEFDPVASASYILLGEEYIIFDPVLGMTGDNGSRYHLLPEMNTASLHEYVNEIVASGILPELVSFYAIEAGQGITFQDKDARIIVLEPVAEPLYVNESEKTNTGE